MLRKHRREHKRKRRDEHINDISEGVPRRIVANVRSPEEQSNHISITRVHHPAGEIPRHRGEAEGEVLPHVLESRDGNPDLGDDKNAHHEEQHQMGDEQPDRRAEDSIAGKDKCPDQDQLQAGFEEEERRVPLDLLECPEIVVLKKVHAFQKDDQGENPGDHRSTIEECNGYGLGQEEQGNRCKARAQERDAHDRVVALLDLLPRFRRREVPDHRVGEAEHHHPGNETDGHDDLDVRPVLFDGEGLGEDREEDESTQADEEVGCSDKAYAPGELVIFLQCI